MDTSTPSKARESARRVLVSRRVGAEPEDMKHSAARPVNDSQSSRCKHASLKNLHAPDRSQLSLSGKLSTGDNEVGARQEDPSMGDSGLCTIDEGLHFVNVRA